jgi:hypothetical protein
MCTTTDLSDFDGHDIKELTKLLSALDKQGLPSDFYNDGVHAMLNKRSYNVFLTNSDYQVAMLNGQDLESFYTCFNCGHEGFSDECQLNENGCNECFPELENEVGA